MKHSPILLNVNTWVGKMSTDDMSKSYGSKTTSISVNSSNIETADIQHQLDLQRLSKKREVRILQYQRYAKTFYGTPAEKELLRKEHRVALLDQLRQNEQAQKDVKRNKVTETRTVVALDKSNQDTDNKRQGTKSQYLKQYRDQNKILMETRAENSRAQREEENRRERELLTHDPINWSKTLV